MATGGAQDPNYVNNLERRVRQLELENEQAQQTIVDVKAKAMNLKSAYQNMLWDYLPRVDPALRHIPQNLHVHENGSWGESDGVSLECGGCNGRIGRFVIGRTIATGRSTKTFFGQDMHSGERVAIKMIPKDGIRQLESLKLVDMEIRTLSLLATRCDTAHDDTNLSSADNPPGILSVHDVLATPSCIFLVAAYGGPDLFHWHVQFVAAREHTKAREHTQVVPEPVVSSIVGQLARALTHCHARGVLHRDVKPENVVVDEFCDLDSDEASRIEEADDEIEAYRIRRLRVRLIDFGCALYHPETCAATDARPPPSPTVRETHASMPTTAPQLQNPPNCPIGSPGFIAPEALMAAAPFDPEKLDSWSLGCIALELCVGLSWFQAHWLQPYLSFAKYIRKCDNSHSTTLARDEFVRCIKANIAAARSQPCLSQTLSYSPLSSSLPIEASSPAEPCAMSGTESLVTMHGAPSSVATANNTADAAEAAAAAHVIATASYLRNATNPRLGSSPNDATCRWAPTVGGPTPAHHDGIVRGTDLVRFVFDALTLDFACRPHMHILAERV